MTKQEKIRKRLAEYFYFSNGEPRCSTSQSLQVADSILKFLKSEGVMLKVEKELPSITNNKGEFKTALEYKKDIIKADLTAYEEII